MSGFVILGTDTDAGKTTFALLWMALYRNHYDYWKPLETGPSDSQKVRELAQLVDYHPPVRHFEEAVAPALAASKMSESIPSAKTLAEQKPRKVALLVETFGSPFSPLNETELQIEFVKRLAMPTLLVSSSAVGAVGRTLATLFALEREGIIPFAVALMGPVDPYAEAEISKHANQIPTVSLTPPSTWDVQGVLAAAVEQGEWLDEIAHHLTNTRSADLQAEQILTLDKTHVWHPYASLMDPDPPTVAVSASDEYLHLEDGRKIIDGISSWWTILHGHRYPPLMKALQEASNKFDHVFFAGVTHEPAVRLADLLLQSAPWKNGRVFYSDNGSTAVEVALKMAYQFWCHRNEPERTLFVGFENGYHGDTFGAMAASRDPVFFGRFEPLLFRTEIVPVSAERLDDSLSKHKGKVAAIIIEPLVQGAGGMQMYSPETLRDIFEVTRKHDVLFIADEVMTGGRRLGPIWAHSLADIAPDLICASKTIAGGVLPIAATLVAPHIVAEWQTEDRSKTFFHGHSFTAHPLACAVGAANWQMVLQQDDSKARRIETFWRQTLTTLQELPQVREVRIRGSIVAVELDIPGGYLADVARQLRHTVLQHGVLLRPLGNVLYAMPPLLTSDESLQTIADAITAAVNQVAPAT